jgi:hypothetical protein
MRSLFSDILYPILLPSSDLLLHYLGHTDTVIKVKELSLRLVVVKELKFFAVQVISSGCHIVSRLMVTNRLVQED